MQWDATNLHLFVSILLTFLKYKLTWLVMYKVEFSIKAAKTYLKLPINIRHQIDVKLDRVAHDPYAKHNNVNALVGMKGCYRLRIGDWRVVYEIINQALKICVIKIGQRKEVYRGI